CRQREYRRSIWSGSHDPSRRSGVRRGSPSHRLEMNRHCLFGWQLIRGRLGIASGIACAAGFLLLGLNSQASQTVERDGGLRPLVAALHVHSTISTGSLNLDQLAERAERLGLDAVVLSENLVLRYEYGAFPLRGVLK